MDAGTIDAGRTDASAICGAGETRCGAQCVDVSTSAEHCGSCEMACEAPPKAVPICIDETCGFECMPGFSDCNGDPADGCEVETASERENCGGCALACEDALSCRESACRPRLVWSRTFGGASTDLVRGVALDPAGNVYITGYYSGTIDLGGGPLASTGTAAFVASYTSSGEHRWSLTSLNVSAAGTVQALSLAFDGSDTPARVHVTGSIRGTVRFDGGGDLVSSGSGDIFIASFEAENGAHLRSRRWGGSGGATARSIAVDTSGNLYVTGYFTGMVDLGRGVLSSGGGTSDIFVASYSASYHETASARWTKHFGGVSWCEGNSIFVDRHGNVYITGYFEERVSFVRGTLDSAGAADVFVASFTPSGVERYSMRAGGSELDLGHGVAADGAGRVYVAGSFQSQNASFGGSPLSSAGHYDVFLAGYEEGSDSGDLHAAHRFSVRAGGDARDEGVALAISPSGWLYATGSFTEEVDLGGGPLIRNRRATFVAAHEITDEGHLNHTSSFAIGGEGGDTQGLSVAASDTFVCIGGEFIDSLTLGERTSVADGRDAFIACFEL